MSSDTKNSIQSTKSGKLIASIFGRVEQTINVLYVVEIERIAPHTNFGGVRCGSFRLAIFTDILTRTVQASRPGSPVPYGYITIYLGFT